MTPIPPPYDHYQGKRVLVTGSSGYVAWTLTHRLAQTHTELVRITRDTRRLPRLDGPAEIFDVEDDISQPSTWTDALRDVDVVFHLAAQTSAREANAAPVEDLHSNVLPILHLLEEARDQGDEPVVIFTGSGTEVGLPDTLPVDESYFPDPATVYDIHKLAGERYLRFYAREGWVKGGTLRLANVYGPGPPSSSADRGVLNMMIRRALDGETLTIYGEGASLRDYVYVGDVVDALLRAGENGGTLEGQPFFVGTGQGVSVAQAIQMVAERVGIKTGREVAVEHVNPPNDLLDIDKRDLVTNPEALYGATGWRPTTDLREGIDRTVKAFESHGQRPEGPPDYSR